MQEGIDELNTKLSEVNERLGVVIALFLRTTLEGKSETTLKEQVKILSDLGVRPRDIASILGRTQPHINKELAGIRHSGKGKKK